MRTGYKSLAALCLSVAMGSSIAALALPKPQDDHGQHDQDQHRVYDPVNKGYRNWDQAEDSAYRRWVESQHITYVDYEHLDHKKQEEYWKWRHKHEDDRH